MKDWSLGSGKEVSGPYTAPADDLGDNFQAPVQGRNQADSLSRGDGADSPKGQMQLEFIAQGSRKKRRCQNRTPESCRGPSDLMRTLL